MDESLRKIFSIRYVKLKFTLTATADALMPKHKTSGLRGGMGEMLLRQNCIRDRNCEACDFKNDCIVRQAMYPRMDIQPTFMKGNDGSGYIISCENNREIFHQGDSFDFYLTLFGKQIAAFSLLLGAFYALGQNGIGKDKATFEITAITNEKKEKVMDGYDIYLQNLGIRRLYEYVQYRESMINITSDHATLKLTSPLSVKHQGQMLSDINMEAFWEALKRRIYILDCLEGIEEDIRKQEYDALPQITAKKCHTVSVPRFSNHHHNKMKWKGIEGTVELSEINKKIWPLLIAGEITHIGKNTSFGFGRYRIIL